MAEQISNWRKFMDFLFKDFKKYRRAQRNSVWVHLDYWRNGVHHRYWDRLEYMNQDVTGAKMTVEIYCDEELEEHWKKALIEPLKEKYGNNILN